MESCNILEGKWLYLSPFLTDFGCFKYKWIQKYPLLAQVVFNVIMPHLRGKMAVTQPLQERFWIFKVQMTTKVPPLTASGSQWNPATSQSENGCNSAMSWLILDFLSTNESQVLLDVIMQHLRGKLAVSQALSWPILDFLKYKWIPKFPLLSQVVLKVIMPRIRAKMAVTQPFLGQFWML